MNQNTTHSVDSYNRKSGWPANCVALTLDSAKVVPMIYLPTSLDLICHN
jgi:hypothetical protein